ncbi:hypothetical protein AAG570_006191 [Ranatra chinensis]|uniref:Uncharacterized protein n=1 Tax=Ranatra chinensis TaxID=642074 RepID=A0ABD0XYC8_9HEMI
MASKRRNMWRSCIGTPPTRTISRRRRKVSRVGDFIVAGGIEVTPSIINDDRPKPLRVNLTRETTGPDKILGSSFALVEILGENIHRYPASPHINGLKYFKQLSLRAISPWTASFLVMKWIAVFALCLVGVMGRGEGSWRKRRMSFDLPQLSGLLGVSNPEEPPPNPAAKYPLWKVHKYTGIHLKPVLPDELEEPVDAKEGYYGQPPETIAIPEAAYSSDVPSSVVAPEEGDEGSEAALKALDELAPLAGLLPDDDPRGLDDILGATRAQERTGLVVAKKGKKLLALLALAQALKGSKQSTGLLATLFPWFFGQTKTKGVPLPRLPELPQIPDLVPVPEIPAIPAIDLPAKYKAPVPAGSYLRIRLPTKPILPKPTPSPVSQYPQEAPAQYAPYPAAQYPPYQHQYAPAQPQNQFQPSPAYPANDGGDWVRFGEASTATTNGEHHSNHRHLFEKGGKFTLNYNYYNKYYNAHPPKMV